MRVGMLGLVALLALGGCYRDAKVSAGAKAKPPADKNVESTSTRHDDLRHELDGLFSHEDTDGDGSKIIADPAPVGGDGTAGEAGPADDMPMREGAAVGQGTWGKGAGDFGERQDAKKEKPKEHGERDEGGGKEAKLGPKPKAATTTSAGGRLTEGQVDEVVSSHSDRFSSCSGVEALVSIRATVGVDGSVMEVNATRSSPDDAKMRDCVTSVFRTLSFPRVEAAWPSRLAFDLRLAPK